MRKLIAGLCAVILATGLMGCDVLSKGNGGDAGGAGPISLSDGPATVEFKGWSISFSKPIVVWSESQSTDLLVLKAAVTNNTGKAASFSDVNNLWAYQKKTNTELTACVQSDSDALLNARQAEADKSAGVTSSDPMPAAESEGLSGEDVSADGGIYQDFSAAQKTIAAGETINVRYVWMISDLYENVCVDVLGYSPSKDDVTLDLGNLPDTEEHARYALLRRSQNVTNGNATEVEIRGATVARPDDWKFESVRTDSVNLRVWSSDEISSKMLVRVKFVTTADPARDRAIKSAANYRLDESAVSTVTLGGVEWHFFCPTPSQFQAYAQATEGVVSVGSDTVRWDDAQAIVERVTVH